MTLTALDHYTIVTDNTDRSVQFYEQVLELKVGARPPFTAPGAWHYVGDQAELHLVERETEDEGSGRLDHIAFRCQGYAKTKARLAEFDVASHERTVPDVDLRQVFIEGPEGVWIELIFQPDDYADGAAA